MKNNDSSHSEKRSTFTESLPPSGPESNDVPDLLPYTKAHSVPVGDKNNIRPTNIEVFTGQAIGVVSQLFEARDGTDEVIKSLRSARVQAVDLLDALRSKQQADLEILKQKFEKIEFAKFGMELDDTYRDVIQNVTMNLNTELARVEQIKISIESALAEYQWTPGQLWLYQWSLVFLLVITGVIEGFFIYLYISWHGVHTLIYDLYSPANVNLLSQMTFVNGPTTMSIAAEVLVWSSLGVWAQQGYINTIKMLRRQFRFADDGPKYMGVMYRNTSVAAIIVIFLKLSKFSLFGVSFDAGNPLAFDFTIGLSFLLGFFGDDAARILSGFRDKIVEGTSNHPR